MSLLSNTMIFGLDKFRRIEYNFGMKNIHKDNTQQGVTGNAGQGRSRGSLKGVTKLGASVTNYETRYNPALLECFENNFPGRDYWVRFTCPEFTAINPVTGEPYLATILIQYIPNGFLVESKSLKLYMFSFRDSQVGGELSELVLADLKKLLKPKYMEVEVRAIPREGIEGRTASFCSNATTKYRKLCDSRKAAFKRQLKAGSVRSMAAEPEEITTLI